MKKIKSSVKNRDQKFPKKHAKEKVIQRRNFTRFKLNIEYEGTRYSGWQKQQNARTVQGELIKACELIFSDDFIDLQGSGRTDSGVHAISQIAHLDVNTVLAPHIIKIKINDILPHDINVLQIEKTNKHFHARHSARSRTYIYKISRRRNAFEKNHIWWIKDELNTRLMKDASELFLGMNDFSSFSDDDENEKSTKVLIDDILVSDVDDMIIIRITGSHFIWKMVRRIVGVLVEVGRGKLSVEDIKYFLSNRSSEPARYTAPPSGLFLESVSY